MVVGILPPLAGSMPPSISTPTRRPMTIAVVVVVAIVVTTSSSSVSIAVVSSPGVPSIGIVRRLVLKGRKLGTKVHFSSLLVLM